MIIKTEVIRSKNVEGVVPRGGLRTKMPSVITMAVEHGFAIEAAGYFEERKAGNIPTTGLIGLQLVGVYATESKMQDHPEPIRIEVEEEGGEVVADEDLEDDAEDIRGRS